MAADCEQQPLPLRVKHHIGEQALGMELKSIQSHTIAQSIRACIHVADTSARVRTRWTKGPVLAD
jgi:hypothetical protein